MQFYPNFALFSALGGMNLEHDFFQMSKLREDQKKSCSPKMEHFFPRIQVKTINKRSSPKMEHFFSRIQMETCAQMQNTVKLLGGDADVDHTQIIGGIQSNY